MMRREAIRYMLLFWTLFTLRVQSAPTLQISIGGKPLSDATHDISVELFADLEQLSRIVDISYCVGLTGTGIQKPFQCASRCHEFEGFELVTVSQTRRRAANQQSCSFHFLKTWNTGPFFSDSCGYIAVSHPPSAPRIIIAFRGTYSITNAIIDLSTVPQEYVPYPGEDDGDENDESISVRRTNSRSAECTNCTVHAGFMTAWRHTRSHIIPHLEELVEKYPGYQLTLVGHSLGGAVAALASLDFHSRGWRPQVTTFGEPRVGNLALMQYFDITFMVEKETDTSNMYRRVTHVDDPVPLLPVSEWGYRMHAGEIYISKPDLSPSVKDLHFCEGDEDLQCIAGAEVPTNEINLANAKKGEDLEQSEDWFNASKGFLDIPARYKIWQLFFAHRDYFWRLGLCIPGGDPKDWYRDHYDAAGDRL